MANIEDVFSLQFRSHRTTGNQQEVRNTFNFRLNPSSPDSVNEQFLVDILADAGTTSLQNAYVALLGTVFTLDEIVARQVHDPLNPGDLKLQHAKVVNLPGTRAVTSDTSSGICAIVTLNTDTVGRRYRGHVFMPPSLRQLDQGDGVFPTGSPYMVAIAALITELNKTLETAGGSHYANRWNDVDMVVYSRKARSLDESQFYAQVQSLIRRTPIHWLRSRSGLAG
jgi:hypothetical protein